MNRSILLLPLLLVFPMLLSAQLLPNGNFESWDSSNRAAPFDWLEPSEWVSSNPLTEFSAAAVSKSNDALSGDYSTEILTTNIQTTIPSYQPSFIALGDAELLPLWATNRFTVIESSGGIPAPAGISGISGFYKFSSSSMGDSAEVRAYLKHRPGPGQSPIFVRGGELSLRPANTWTSFELDFDSLAPQAGDSLVVIVYSTKKDAPLQGGNLKIDSLTYKTQTTSIPAIGNFDLSIYPNPATDKVSYTLWGDVPAAIRMFDIVGNEVIRVSFPEKEGTIDVSSLSEGVYLLQFVFRDRIETKKLTVNN